MQKSERVNFGSKIVPDMDVTFDLAFVDGNKRFYVEYYEMILKKMNSGGYIIADNTLWDGHGHGLKNNGKEELVMVAVILKK